jgi:hypothetical protein
MNEPTKGNRVTTEVATRRDIPLNWDVFVTPGIPVVNSDLPPGTKQEWISALDTIESLNARAVIAGHKRPGNDDSHKIIEQTRQLHPRFRPRSRDDDDRARALRQDAGALSGSGGPIRG